jgi:Flp pilus assembly protein TadB
MANVLSDALQVGATYLQHGMHWLKCRHPSQLLARVSLLVILIWFLFVLYTFLIFTLFVLTLWLVFTCFLIFRYSSEGFVKETLLSLAEFLQVTHIYIHV